MWEAGAVGALLLYFAGRVIFFAFKFDPAIPPDELTHFARCQLYAEQWGLPSDSPETYSMGLIQHTPWLYYFAMGKMLPLNVWGIDDLTYLRLLSAGFGLATVLVAWRWMRLVTSNALVRVLAVLMMTNTLMFTAICAAVSYDGLVNFLAALSVYFFSRHVKHNDARSLVLLVLSLCLGALTKVTFLPLAAALLIAVLFHDRKAVLHAPAKFLAYLRQASSRDVAALAVMVIGLVLCAWLYGGNLLRFGALEPPIDQVMTEAQIMQSPVWARNRILDRFRRGELSFVEARAQAETIGQEAARRDTIKLVNAEEARRRGVAPVGTLNRLGYTVMWVWLMSERTFGFLGHEVLLKEGWPLLPYGVIFLAAFAMFVQQWRPKTSGPLDGYLALTVLFYALVLMQVINYAAYRNTGVVVMTVQGRYLFPVLVPLYGLTARYLLEFWPRWVRVVLFILASVVFIYGDFPFFLSRVEPVTFYR